MIKILLYFIFLKISNLALGSSIPHTLIIDNPNKFVTTFEIKKNKERADLNLNIRKRTSKKIKAYINKEEKIIFFLLKKKDMNEDFYLTKNLNKIKKNKSYHPFKIDKNKGQILFKYDYLPEVMYLISYNKKNMLLNTIYKLTKNNIEYINSKYGSLSFEFNEKYKFFEIINIFKPINKGTMKLTSGNTLKIDSLNAKEIKIKDTTGKSIITIPLKKGSGTYKLDNSKKWKIYFKFRVWNY